RKGTGTTHVVSSSPILVLARFIPGFSAGWRHFWHRGLRQRKRSPRPATAKSCRLRRDCHEPHPGLKCAAEISDTGPFQMSSSEAAILSIDGAVATFTLNRPEAFNSVNLAIAQKLEQLGAEVEANDDVKVLVIQGEGRAFSAGGDLQTIGAAAEADTIAPVVGELLKHYHAFIETVRRMPKIVVSSGHGSAAGAGMGLRLITHLRLCPGGRERQPARR